MVKLKLPSNLQVNRYVVGGAVGAAILDWALEYSYYAFGINNVSPVDRPFPYEQPPAPIPNVDDLLVAAVPAAIAVVGMYKNDKKLFDIGLGGMVYAGPMLVYKALEKQFTWPVMATASFRVAQSNLSGAMSVHTQINKGSYMVKA